MQFILTHVHSGRGVRLLKEPNMRHYGGKITIYALRGRQAVNWLKRWLSV